MHRGPQTIFIFAPADNANNVNDNDNNNNNNNNTITNNTNNNNNNNNNNNTTNNNDCTVGLKAVRHSGDLLGETE